jgi:branched-chain amino acid aminotransferase
VYVRYTITRGEGPIDLVPAEGVAPRYVIIVREVPKWREEYYTHGVDVAVVGTRRNPQDALDPNIKGGNYLNNVLGVIEARALGADDCLMLNAQGLVTEASNSNVFFVIDGDLITPGQRAGNLRGLTKAAVHEACRARGLATRERDVPVEGARSSAG